MSQYPSFCTRVVYTNQAESLLRSAPRCSLSYDPQVVACVEVVVVEMRDELAASSLGQPVAFGADPQSIARVMRSECAHRSNAKKIGRWLRAIVQMSHSKFCSVWRNTVWCCNCRSRSRPYVGVMMEIAGEPDIDQRT